MSNKPLSDEAGEVRELAAAGMKRLKPASDALPAELVTVLPKRKRGQRGPAKRPAKVSITIRLDPEIVQYFRSTGPGWHVRINKTLKDAIGRSR